MNEELIEKLVIEIERSCADSCPCWETCRAKNDEDCFAHIRSWLASNACIDTIVSWVRSGLGLKEPTEEHDYD